MTYKELLNDEYSIICELDGYFYHVFESTHKNEHGEKLIAVMIRDIEQCTYILHERYNSTDIILDNLKALPFE